MRGRLMPEFFDGEPFSERHHLVILAMHHPRGAR
jgi:hypothetical protein